MISPSVPLLSKQSSQTSHKSSKPLSPLTSLANSISGLYTLPFQGQEVKSISDIISSINSYITDKFSVLSNTTYNFTDVKLLSNHSYAFGVTNEGYCISLNLLENLFEEVSLCKNGLSGILIFNNEKSALVKEKANGKIYLLEIPTMNIMRVINVQGEGNNGIGRMCISPDERFLFARLWKGEIVRWDLKSFEQDLSLMVRQGICMNIAPDGKVVVGTLDKKILVFSMELEKVLEKSFDFKVDAFISFSKSGHLILLAMATEVRVVNKESLNLVKVFKVGCQVYECVMTENSGFLIAPLESGEIVFIDMKNSSKVFRLQVHSSSIKSIFLIASETQILSFGDDFKVGRTKFPELSNYKRFSSLTPKFQNQLSPNSQDLFKETLSSQLSDPDDKHFKVFCLCESHSSDLILVGGQSKKIIIWDSKSSRKIGTLSGHDDYIYSLECISDEIVASGSADSSIKLWNYRTLNYLFTLQGHHDTVTCLTNIDCFRLASGSRDKSIKIWLWEEKSILFQINSLKSQVCSFLKPRPEILLVGMRELIQCWELKSYTLLFEKKSSAQNPNLKALDTIIEGSSRAYITLGNEEDSVCFSDPFKTQEVKVVGEDEYAEYKFLAYLQTIIMYKVPLYDDSNDKWMIFPYMVNSLHYYAYFDMPDFLYQGLMNGAGLVTCTTGETPLTIAINKRHKECIQSIIKAAWDKRFENPNLLASLNLEAVLMLSSLNISSLAKLFDLVLVKYEGSCKFCPESCELPAIKSSVTPFVMTGNIFNWEVNNEKEIEVGFKRSLMPIYLEIGSKKSIEFIECICAAEQVKIFRSEFMRMVVEYKWRVVKKFAFMEFCVFLSFYGCALFMNDSSLVPLIIASVLNIFLTTINIIITVASHNLDYWSVCDYIRFIIMIIYTILYLFDIKVAYIHILLIIATLIQGMHYFKLFKRTRRLVMVLMKIGYDIISFVIILIYLLVSLGAILHIIAVKEDFHSINTMSLIEISEENASVFIENIFLVFMTFINPIIMLNILLALSTENYQKDNSKAKETRELTLSILRYEYLLTLNRDQSSFNYLQICTKLKKTKTNKIKVLSTLIKKLSSTQKSNQADLLKKLSTISDSFSSLQSKVTHS